MIRSKPPERVSKSTESFTLPGFPLSGPTLKKTAVFTLPGFPLSVLRMKHGATPMHRHEFTELVVIIEGNGNHYADGTEYPISRGDIFVIKGHQVHGYRTEKPFLLVNILFDLPKLSIPLKDLETIPGYNVLFKIEPAWRARPGFKSRLRLSLNNLAEVEDIIGDMESELDKRPPGYQFMASSLLMRLIAYLGRCYTQSPDENCHTFVRLAKAIDCLESRYQQPLSLSQLADISHMSVRHFQRAFRKVMGTSPIDHLARLRINRGAELLRREKDLNITEIAYRVGFQDSNYFARRFRGVMGCSPREYRLRAVE